MSAVDRYPLSWPSNWPRTPRLQRRTAAFSKSKTEMVTERDFRTQQDVTRKKVRTLELSAGDAAQRLEDQIDRLGGTHATLSTNMELRMDGRPRQNQGEPYEPGAAVYFTFKGKPICLACDKWNRVADNIAALAAHIDALRRIDRYGVGRLEQAFAGYAALPAQASPWWTVLDFKERPTDYGEVINRHSALAKVHHPDRGGSVESMAKINAARDAARLDLASS